MFPPPWPPSIEPLTLEEIEKMLLEPGMARLGDAIPEQSVFNPAMSPRLFLRILATLREVKMGLELHRQLTHEG